MHAVHNIWLLNLTSQPLIHHHDNQGWHQTLSTYTLFYKKSQRITEIWFVQKLRNSSHFISTWLLHECLRKKVITIEVRWCKNDLIKSSSCVVECMTMLHFVVSDMNFWLPTNIGRFLSDGLVSNIPILSIWLPFMVYRSDSVFEKKMKMKMVEGFSYRFHPNPPGILVVVEGAELQGFRLLSLRFQLLWTPSYRKVVRGRRRCRCFSRPAGNCFSSPVGNIVGFLRHRSPSILEQHFFFAILTIAVFFSSNILTCDPFARLRKKTHKSIIE